MAGLISGVAVLINFAFAPLPLLMGLYTLAYTFRFTHSRSPYQVRLRAATTIGIFYGLGLVLPWLLFWLFSGLTPFDLLRTSFEFHLDLDRPYWFWVGMHLWDWVAWTGVAFALLTVAGVVVWWRDNVFTESHPLPPHTQARDISEVRQDFKSPLRLRGGDLGEGLIPSITLLSGCS
jgi:hypothetical protein